MSPKVLSLVVTWGALMALLAATVGASFAPLGALKPVVNLGIAFAKAGLIASIFMHLRDQGGLARLFALAAVAWLVILLALTQADVWSRGWLQG